MEQRLVISRIEDHNLRRLTVPEGAANIDLQFLGTTIGDDYTAVSHNFYIRESDNVGILSILFERRSLPPQAPE